MNRAFGKLGRVAVKREKDDALVIKMNEIKYSEVLKAMPSSRISSINEMFLEPKRDKTCEDAAFQCLTKEVHHEGVEVSMVKNLDDDTNVKELVLVLRQFGFGRI